VLYGFAAFLSLQSAPDWEDNYADDYQWFLDFYLDKMKQNSEAAGKRLLDVLDLHWYSEARADGQRIVFNEGSNSEAVQKARVQAPRMLWDPSYEEDSWIGESWTEPFRPIIPKIKESIANYNPGTKLAFTEYSHGAEGDISGGIAQADTLGIFGKYGVYLSTLWPSDSNLDYAAAAYNIYRNYDGNKSKFGNLHVQAESSDYVNSSIYASVNTDSEDKLHMIVINKNMEQPIAGTFNIDSSRSYNSAEVYAFDSSSPEITERTPVTNIYGNEFEYTIPPFTVAHVVLKSEESPEVKTGDVNGDSNIDSLDYSLLRNYMLGEIDKFSYEYGMEAADVNNDGVINSLDSTYVKRYILGTIDQFPE
jgi:hypothetical protein